MSIERQSARLPATSRKHWTPAPLSWYCLHKANRLVNLLATRHRCLIQMYMLNHLPITEAANKAAHGVRHPTAGSQLGLPRPHHSPQASRSHSVAHDLEYPEGCTYSWHHL